MHISGTEHEIDMGKSDVLRVSKTKKKNFRGEKKKEKKQGIRGGKGQPPHQGKSGKGLGRKRMVKGGGV